MAAYILADVEVTDAAGFGAYRKQVPATVEKYGGKFCPDPRRRRLIHAGAPRRGRGALRGSLGRDHDLWPANLLRGPRVVK